MRPDDEFTRSLRRLTGGEVEVRDPNRRDVLKIIAALAASMMVPGCREPAGPVEHGGGGDTKYSLPVNPTDPMLLRATSKGRTVEYFGTRDAAGAAAAVTHIAVTEKAGESIWYTLRPDGRPARAATPNGTGFEFTWVSKTQLSVTALAPDGRNQVTTTVNLAGGAVHSRAAALPVNALAPRAARGDRRVTLTRSDVIDAPPATRSGVADRALGAAAPNVTIQVLKCGAASTQPLTVSVRVADATGAFLAEVPAYPMAGGTYAATIPGGIAPSLNPSKVCHSIADALGNVCDWIISQPAAPVLICSALGAAIAATGPLAVVLAVPVGDACFSVAAGLELYCATLGGSPVPGAPTLADAICDAPELNRTFTGGIRLAAVGLAIPSNLMGPSVLAPGAGPYPTLQLDLGARPAVRSLALTPPNPGAGQGYTATAQVSCLPAGTNVALGVVGTDGYADSANQRVAATQQNGTFTLTVPGGQSGIRDVVTVTVTPPNAPVVTFTAALVFG